MSEPRGVIDPEIVGTFCPPPPLVGLVVGGIAFVDVRKLAPVDRMMGLPRWRCAFCGGLTFIGVSDELGNGRGRMLPPWCSRFSCVEWGALVASRWPGA